MPWKCLFIKEETLLRLRRLKGRKMLETGKRVTYDDLLNELIETYEKQHSTGKSFETEITPSS